ncbi:flagellar motor protein MotB [Azospirillum sp. B506]|uniref:flagellar motor protein MotB n=1 Tax=Azospirillum sp. B506 TaxID=137721 RepID=UPI00034AA5BA|nr:flagellar motor protein MotB [Azospirillum sp. B506]
MLPGSPTSRLGGHAAQGSGTGAGPLPLLARAGWTSRAEGHANPNNGSILLLLSLFLLLLVFFIVLNAQSVQTAQKVKAVAASLERTFPSFVIDPRLRDGSEPVASRAGTVFAVQRLEEVGTLFATAVAVSKVEVVAPGQLLEVRLPADDLFLPGTMTLRADRQGLIDRIADALRQSRQGERVELDALLGIGPTGTPSQPPGPVARAGVLARALVGDGAPAGNVTVGIERGQPGGVRLLFSLRWDEGPAARPVAKPAKTPLSTRTEVRK